MRQPIVAKAVVDTNIRSLGKKTQQRRRVVHINQRSFAKNRAVYNIPDVSQGVIESNVLPRSTEHMRRLFMIA